MSCHQDDTRFLTRLYTGARIPRRDGNGFFDKNVLASAGRRTDLLLMRAVGRREDYGVDIRLFKYGCVVWIGCAPVFLRERLIALVRSRVAGGDLKPVRFLDAFRQHTGPATQPDAGETNVISAHDD